MIHVRNMADERLRGVSCQLSAGAAAVGDDAVIVAVSHGAGCIACASALPFAKLTVAPVLPSKASAVAGAASPLTSSISSSLKCSSSLGTYAKTAPGKAKRFGGRKWCPCKNPARASGSDSTCPLSPSVGATGPAEVSSGAMAPPSLDGTHGSDMSASLVAAAGSVSAPMAGSGCGAIAGGVLEGLMRASVAGEMVQPSRAEISSRISSQLPSSSALNLRCGSGSRLIRICGTSGGIMSGIRATGLTLSEEPITMTRSQVSASRGRFS
mmetsp:Transcript_37299/g.97791  ORF Transcript_37299/g.97791 Transcript_37299/m.97791 type:complete len:268 (+) Transcript_37299:70-873(+)